MRKRDSLAHRAHILAAAQQLVAERGSGAAVRVEEIAARAGISKQAFYRRFRNREVLVAELARSGVDVGLPNDRRAQILDAALRIVASDGLAGVTIERVMAEAGGGRAAIYACFGDKDGLLLALIDRLTERLDLTDVVAGADPADPEPLLVEVARRGLAAGREQLELWHLLVAGVAGRADWTAAVRERAAARLWDPLVRYLESAAAVGSIAPGDALLRGLAFHGTLLLRADVARRRFGDRGNLPEADDAARKLTSLFMRGIATPW